MALMQKFIQHVDLDFEWFAATATTSWASTTWA